MILQKVSPKIIFCWLEGWWNLLKYGQNISGHTFQDFGIRKTKDKTIIYSKCIRCGLVDFSWSSKGGLYDNDERFKGLKKI